MSLNLRSSKRLNLPLEHNEEDHHEQKCQFCQTRRSSHREPSDLYSHQMPQSETDKMRGKYIEDIITMILRTKMTYSQNQNRGRNRLES